MSAFEDIYSQISHDPMNAALAAKGYVPVYTASEQSRIMLIGQAPGRKAQETQRPWNDASGILLRKWLGVTDEQFYDPDLFALTPMDFYYPGKATHGDLPPRKEFAALWHPKLRALMPNVQLTILVGAYAQRYYLQGIAQANVTRTLEQYHIYLPDYFPLVHPSPLNIGWRKRNPWFEQHVIPELQTRVRKILS